MESRDEETGVMDSVGKDSGVKDHGEEETMGNLPHPLGLSAGGFFVLVLIGLLLYWLYSRRNKIREDDIEEQLGSDREEDTEYKISASGVPRIDLHGKPVAEALDATKNFLEDCEEGQVPRLMIITGRGLHSTNRQPKIKPAVIKILVKRHLDYKEICKGGALEVYLSYRPENVELW